MQYEKANMDHLLFWYSCCSSCRDCIQHSIAGIYNKADDSYLAAVVFSFSDC